MKAASSRYIMLFLFAFSWGFGQGSGLLIQQYNRGPALDSKFSRWTLQPRIELNRFNTDLNSTTPEFTVGGRLSLEYRLSSTVGLESGVGFTPIAYSYAVGDSLGIDHLKYLTFPLGIKLHPTSRISIGLGGNYNLYQQGAFWIKKEPFKRKESYPLEVFSNTFGGFLQLEYHFFWGGTFSLHYIWATRKSPLTQPQTNTTSGFRLGIAYSIWRSGSKR